MPEEQQLRAHPEVEDEASGGAAGSSLRGWAIAIGGVTLLIVLVVLAHASGFMQGLHGGGGH